MRYFFLILITINPALVFAQGTESTGISWWTTLVLVGIALVVLFLFYIGAIAISFWMRSYLTKKQKEYLTIEYSKNVIILAGRVIFLVILAAGIILALTISSIVTEMGWLIGALGLAIGVATKDVLANYIAGIMLLAQEKTKAGTVLEVDGYRGKIIEIGPRVTLVRVFDGREILIPNQMFFSEIVTFYNTMDLRKIKIHLVVRYKADVTQASRLILQILQQEKTVLPNQHNAVLVTEFTDGGVHLEIRYWITPKGPSWIKGKSRILGHIARVFHEQGIALAPTFHERYMTLPHSLDARPHMASLLTSRS